MDKKICNDVRRLTDEAKRKISEVMRRERIGYNERDALASAVSNMTAIANIIASLSPQESKTEPK